MIESVEKTGYEGTLSYSSFKMYMACNRKYLLKKVQNVQPDLDAEEDTAALRFGKAFHKLLEDSKHDTSLIKVGAIKDVCSNFDLTFETDGPHLLALLRHFKVLQSKSGLKATHCEVEIKTEKFLGYIDVILQDQAGGWHIGDMKTSSSYRQTLHSELSHDWQLNLYAYHAKEIAVICGLDVKDFKGCRYLLAVKTKTKMKSGEDFLSFADRLMSHVSCHDIAVSADEMVAQDTYGLFKKIHAEVKTLRAMKSEAAEKFALPNFNSCVSYFRPCEFWSKCHGKSFTEGQAREVVSSAD